MQYEFLREYGETCIKSSASIYVQVNINVTYQNFNSDMHANFDVVAYPIPVISLYWDPPEVAFDT